MKNQIEFDEQDRNLFEISDLRLRADALKYSVLPRLQVLMNVCIGMVRDAFGVEVLEDSMLSLSPNFRTKRAREIQVGYWWASVQLGGKRALGMWPGLEREDGKSVQIVPYLFGFNLTAAGLEFRLVAKSAIRLTEKSKRGLIRKLRRHGPMISELRGIASIEWRVPVMCEVDRLQRQLDEGDFEIEYWSETVAYPVTMDKIKEMAFKFVMFFPVFDLCIRYAKGEPDRFDAMIFKANQWIMSLPATVEDEIDKAGKRASSVGGTSAARSAEKRIKVMPALRWQVFQRDGWKCVACGRQSHDGLVLHIDHVLPRSKGGKDVLENLQTLCSECNIGKGNRDATNLRVHE